MQQPGREGMRSSIDFSCSDPKLTQAFQWAKEQALAYAFEGDPVGKWYEAALPGREAFCMRDTAHQATGAHFLGLAEHTYNMLYKFAVNISPSRDWCSFWEIDRHDRPAPVDYTDDADFWYNLPANFDVLDCCYRQYCWTGDRRYLEHPVFLEFYDRTVDDYVRTWDRDGDGFPEWYPEYGRQRGDSGNHRVRSSRKKRLRRRHPRGEWGKRHRPTGTLGRCRSPNPRSRPALSTHLPLTSRNQSSGSGPRFPPIARDTLRQ